MGGLLAHLLRGSGLVALVATAAVTGAGAGGARTAGVGVGAGQSRLAADNADRFAALTLGEGRGPAALAATAGTDGRSGAHQEQEASAGPSELPKALTRTEYRTPNGWLLRPAGTQIDVARAPTGVTVSPDHDLVAVISSGIFNEDLTVIDAREPHQATPYPVADGYMGVAIDGQGGLWASTGSRNRVYQFGLAGSTPVPQHAGTPLLPQGTINGGIPVAGYPGNMVLDDAEEKLYVVGNLSVPEDARTGDCPGGSTICSVVSVIDVASASVETQIAVGRDAFDVVLNRHANKLYVTNWADETDPARAGGTGSVSVVDLDLATPREVQVVAVGRHPTGMALSPDGQWLFVANSADDALSKLRVNEDGRLGADDAPIEVGTTTGAPQGATPIAVAFSADGRYLLVGLAGQNAIRVLNANGTTTGLLQRITTSDGHELADVPTYIPTGWYPSGIAAAPHPDDETKGRVYVTNLKGIGAGPGGNFQAQPFSGVRTQGTLSVIDLDPSRFGEWTRTVVENNGWAPLFANQVASAAADPCQPAPLPDGGAVHSQLLCDAAKGDIDTGQLHVVYVVKENKTFDQYFGDIAATIPDADADPTFLLYGEAVTTNQHELARRFALGDAFWADSEQSTTGHSWTSAAYASEHNEITWNPEYSQGIRGQRGDGVYDGQYVANPSFSTGVKRDQEIEDQEDELFEPEERLVDRFADPATNPRGATFRIYSGDVDEDSPAVRRRVPLGLWGLGAATPHVGGDLEFPDTDRAELFVAGRTVSNAWTLTGGGPPATFGKEIAFCGAPDPSGPDDNAEGWDCDREGATSDEYGSFALEAWEKQYQDCMAGRPPGTDDADCQRTMPNFLYLVLPVDHTLGFNPLAPTPASMVADNDFAFGRIVEALSQSPFWKNTLILTTEDDTQLAGDHVDSHRTFLLAAGGLARRHGPEGKASHQPASLPSILKTVEVLFGISEPLSIYDRAATPLHDFIVDALAEANDEKYTAVRPAVPFGRNAASGDLATLSGMLDWRLDRTEPGLLTALMYYGEKGWPLPARYRRLLEQGD